MKIKKTPPQEMDLIKKKVFPSRKSDKISFTNKYVTI
jgi:hypothetical protein